MQFPVLRIGKKETKLKQTFGVCSCSWLLLAVGILLLTFRKNLISLQLVSSHTQSQGGNGLPRLTRPSDWSAASAPASDWLMVTSGQSPGPHIIPHKEQLSILDTRSTEKLQNCADHRQFVL